MLCWCSGAVLLTGWLQAKKERKKEQTNKIKNISVCHIWFDCINPTSTKPYNTIQQKSTKLVQVRLRHQRMEYTCMEMLAGQHQGCGLAWVGKGSGYQVSKVLSGVWGGGRPFYHQQKPNLGIMEMCKIFLGNSIVWQNNRSNCPFVMST